MMKKALAAAVLFLVLMILTTTCACAQDAPQRTVVDMAGRTVVVPEKVDSYVDIWYSHQSILALLDKCEHMVYTSYKRDDVFCAWFFEMFPDVKESDIEHMNVEELLNLGVQVVFYQFNSDKAVYADQLADVGIAAIAVDFDTIDSMKQSVRMVAEVLNTDYAREKAELFIEELDSTIAGVQAVVGSIPDSDKVRVLNVRNFSTLRADGTGTVADTWIGACGGINVVSADGLPGTQYVNVEQIFEWDPDMIFSSATGDAAFAYSQEGFSSLKCVQNKNIYDNPSGLHYWNRYSSEIVLQLKWASALFYPELFPDADIAGSVHDFYLKFYDYDMSEENIDRMLHVLPPVGWGE